MEAQMHRQYEEDTPITGLQTGGEEYNQTGEKKSVIKKVKDKAKKIKDTLKKHGHGNEQEHRHEGGIPADEEDEEDDHEMMGDPEVHGGPIYDSTVIRSTNLPSQEDRSPYDPIVKDERRNQQSIPEPARPFGLGSDYAGNKSDSPAMPTSHDVQRNTEIPRETGVKLGESLGLEEDPHSKINRPEEIPPSNYQSKVPDPTGTGGKEVDVSPLIDRLDNLTMHDETATKPGAEGSHDQFSPVPISTRDQMDTDSSPKCFGPNESEGIPRDTTVAGKISSSITDKAASAKNAVASRLGYGGTESPKQEGGVLDSADKSQSETSPGYTQMIAEKLTPIYDRFAGAGTAMMSRVSSGGRREAGQDTTTIKPGTGIGTETTPGYTRRIAEKLSPVYDKVAGAGTAVMSKFQGGGGGSPRSQGGEGADKGVSMTEYLAEKFRPGDEDKALSEVITDRFKKKTGEERPAGVVTESEEVASRLGSGLEGKREGEDAFEVGRESSGAGVVDRLKDEVGSWIGKSTGTETAQDSINKAHVSNPESAPAGEGLGSREVVDGVQPAGEREVPASY